MATDRLSGPRALARRLLFDPVDIASLAAFRILFGLMMACAVVRFLAKGWVQTLYIAPRYHIPWPGVEWVHVWPGPWMYVHFGALLLFALMIAAGWFYRLAVGLFLVGFTWIELIDQTLYLNHYYLISLICLLLLFLPANRTWSLDVRRQPAIRTDVVPAWTINLLRLQVGVVYFFAGLHKLNPDWLIYAQPLRIWLPARSELPLVGWLLDDAWVAYAASWFGAVFDLSIVFLLLWSRTRLVAYAAVLFFHVMTWLLFPIGMFPWIMTVCALVFFPVDWPRKLLNRLGTRAAQSASEATSKLPAPPGWWARWIAWPVSMYALLQVLLPLRPYLYAGPSGWSYEGFNFSWQVMLVEKTGDAKFYAFDPTTGRRHRIPVSDYLTRRQEIMMAQDPHLIRLLARKMAADLRASGQENVHIQVEAYATMNGRFSQALIKPFTDLAADDLPDDWIVPLEATRWGDSISTTPQN